MLQTTCPLEVIIAYQHNCLLAFDIKTFKTIMNFLIFS